MACVVLLCIAEVDVAVGLYCLKQFSHSRFDTYFFMLKYIPVAVIIGFSEIRVTAIIGATSTWTEAYSARRRKNEEYNDARSGIIWEFSDSLEHNAIALTLLGESALL